MDYLEYIRQLKDKNIAVIFEKENINTMDSKGEVQLTIMECPYHKRGNIAGSNGQGY